MSNTYADFSNLTRSSKLVLCHIEPAQRLSVFTLDSGTIYKKSVNHFVVNLKEDGIDLTEASSAAVSTGEWYYDHLTGTLYVNTTDDTDPKTHTMVVTYRLFYSNRPVDLPYNLSTGAEVHYDSRLKSNSPIKKELDDEQIGIVLETSTSISLENTDGHFDDFYDVLIFENKEIRFWSWSEKLPLSEKQKLFDGNIQTKTFTSSQVRFSCKDFTLKLREPLTHEKFSISDGDVPERYLNTPKRRLFGQFKQLQCVPVDAILDGFDLTGTISGTAASATITGSGTSFLSELSPADVIIYETPTQNHKFNVATIASDTSLTLSEALDINLSSESVIIKPKRPYRGKNREWHIAGHKLRAPNTTVSSGTQPNRFTVVDSTDLFAGDLITVDGENGFIQRLSGNDITLTANLQGGTPSASDVVTKSPVSKAFISGEEIFIDRDWAVTNGTGDATLSVDPLAEFNVATAIDISNTLTFTSGSRNITVSGLDFRNEFRPRDWIRSDDITHTTWYEILEVQENTAILRTAYGGGSTSTQGQKKNVTLLDDNAVVTVNCVGQERAGVWIKTASDAVKDILENDGSFTNINTASFTESDADAPFVLSYVAPKKIGGRVAKIKDVISDINESVFGSLVTDSNFDLRYQVLTPEKPTDLTVLRDDDLSQDSVTIRTKSEIVRAVSAKYSHFTDKFEGSEAFELYSFENDFVDDLIGSRAELELDLYLFNLDDATTIAQRYALYNSLSQSSISIKGKLDLALKSLNDKIYIQLDRLYKRFGSSSNRKIGIINKVTNNGADVELEINDLGNVFNRVANVSDNSANEFTSADDNEKMLYSYIADDDTLTPDTTSDDELFTNLIG